MTIGEGPTDGKRTVRGLPTTGEVVLLEEHSNDIVKLKCSQPGVLLRAQKHLDQLGCRAKTPKQCRKKLDCETNQFTLKLKPKEPQRTVAARTAIGAVFS